jgi:hypothetical protein
VLHYDGARVRCIGTLLNSFYLAIRAKLVQPSNRDRRGTGNARDSLGDFPLVQLTNSGCDCVVTRGVSLQRVGNRLNRRLAAPR